MTLKANTIFLFWKLKKIKSYRVFQTTSRATSSATNERTCSTAKKSKGKKVSMNQNSNSNVDYKPRAYTNLIGSMEKFWPLPMLRKNTLQTLTKLMDKTNLRWYLLHGQKKKKRFYTHFFLKLLGLGRWI